MTPKPARILGLSQLPCKTDARCGRLAASQAAKTAVEQSDRVIFAGIWTYRSQEEMEKRSDRHIRDLVAHTAFKGLDANEIGCARISVMAGSNCSLQRAEYR